MPITIEWANAEHTAIVRRFIGQWTWEEYASVDETMNEMMATVSHVVPVVNDLRESLNMVPAGVVKRIPGLIRELPANRGPDLIVGASALVPLLYRNLTTEYGSQSGLPQPLFFATLDEAHAYVQTMSSSMNADEAPPT